MAELFAFDKETMYFWWNIKKCRSIVGSGRSFCIGGVFCYSVRPSECETPLGSVLGSFQNCQFVSCLIFTIEPINQLYKKKCFHISISICRAMKTYTIQLKFYEDGGCYEVNKGSAFLKRNYFSRFVHREVFVFTNLAERQTCTLITMINRRGQNYRLGCQKDWNLIIVVLPIRKYRPV